MVMLLHIWVLELRFGNDAHVMPQFFRSGNCGVDLFFVISGFVMATISRGAFKNRSGIIRFVYNRVTRIYPVYWFYCLPALFIFLVRPDLVNIAQGNKVDLLRSFLLLPQKIKPLLAVGWTLIHEMHFYTVMVLLLIFPERFFLRLLLLWAIIVTAANMIISDCIALPPLAWIALHPLSLEFIAGCFVARFTFAGVGRYRIPALWIGFALLFAAAIFYAYIFPSVIEAAEWPRVIMFGLPATLIVYGSSSFNSIRTDHSLPRFMLLMGDASYSLYLSHALVATAVGMAWSLLGLGKILSNHFLVATMLITCLTTGILSYIFIEVPVMARSRALYSALSRRDFL